MNGAWLHDHLGTYAQVALLLALIFIGLITAVRKRKQNQLRRANKKK